MLQKIDLKSTSQATGIKKMDQLVAQGHLSKEQAAIEKITL